MTEGTEEGKVKGQSEKEAVEPEGLSKESKEVVDSLIANYKKLEESIVSQLGFRNKKHGGITGTLREEIWLQLFEQIIPTKYSLEHSVMIIDSQGKVSREIDLAIVDNNYTPYIFQYGCLKFVPIEAVAAVVECKSQSPDKETLESWLGSIAKLRTSQQSIVRMATAIVVDGTSYFKGNIDGSHQESLMQSSTRPIRIFCGYNSEGANKFIEENFDITLIAKEDAGEGGIKLNINTEKDKSLQAWYLELNHYGIKPKDLENEIGTVLKKTDETNPGDQENKDEGQRMNLESYRIIHENKEVPLMSFNFILNQLLMLLNNPIPFPHYAYSELFNGRPKKADHERKSHENDAK